jgi:hypothetical protein
LKREYKEPVPSALSVSTRSLALLAAMIGATAIAISVSPIFAVLSAAQIIGALILTPFPRFGTVLIWIGAIILSLGIVPLGLGIAIASFETLSRYHDFNIVGITLLWCLATVLQVWLDVCLVLLHLGRTATDEISPAF